MNHTFWTNQKTGEPIGPLYSWNDIREMQLDEFMGDMCRQRKIGYLDKPIVPPPLDVEFITEFT